MQQGRILVAEQSGAFVLKLVGDVRLSFCTALDAFLDRMFAAPDFASVIIDLTEAENIDSTTLGQLVKLAISAHRRYKLTPLLLSTNPDITRVLECMGCGRVFDIRQERPQTREELRDLPQVEGSESAVRERVIEAHQVLMGINEQNRAKFQELVCALESSRT
jgi:anti-anti-sigma factor